MNAALVHVFFWNEVVTGLGRMVLDVILGEVGAFGPGVKRGAQLGFHGLGIEIAAEAEDDVIRMGIDFVPVEQILPSDGCDRGIFGLPGIVIVFTVCQLDGFAVGNSADFIIAPRDAVVCLLLRQVELVGAGLWM